MRTCPRCLQGLLSVAVFLALLPSDSAQAQRRRGRDDRNDRRRESRDEDGSSNERQALADLLEEIQGTIVFSRRGRIRSLKIGERESENLGEGDAARWSPDGKRLAVYDGGDVFVMNADGSERKRLYDDADDLEDGSPIEFHTNGQEILFVRRRSGLWSVPIDGGKAERLDLPGRYTGEPGISADGKRMAVRMDHDLYAVDLARGRHRKFGRGCGPCISPDGELLVNNVGSHRQLAIQNWDGDDPRRLDARMLRPDRSWDDFHWSNHQDYIAVQGERNREEAYVVNVAKGSATRVTWEGRIRVPDLFVAGVEPPVAEDRDRSVARSER